MVKIQQSRQIWFTACGVENTSPSAVFVIPVALEASGPSWCWGCFTLNPGVATQIWCYVWFLKWVKQALFSLSWDCNSQNQNCIFHKYIILPATSIQDNTRLLIPFGSWYCHVESVLCYSLPWISQGSKQDPGLHFLLPKRSQRKLHSSRAAVFCSLGTLPQCCSLEPMRHLL